MDAPPIHNTFQLMDKNHMKTTSISAIFVSIFALACSTQSEPRSVATGASCGSLEGSDVVLSELYKPGTIYRAEPIEEQLFRARASQPTRVMGASLRVRAEPGMTAPYMQRVLACHAASGNSAHPNDPLAPQNGQLARLSVEESQFGFTVNVVGDSPKSGEEIWQRAEVLTSQGGTVEVEQVGSLSPTSSF